MPILGKYFDQFLIWLQPPRIELMEQYRELLSDCSELVDLGCGEGNHLSGVTRPTNARWIGIDSHKASLDKALHKDIYSEVVADDILSWLRRADTSSVDTILASCVVEHLTKDDGILLLSEMKRVCKRRAIIFTPNGFVPQPPDVDNAANEHKSGWSVKDLNSLGFQVTSGLYGYKPLRGSFGLPAIRPHILGDLIAKATSRLVFRFPRFAYQIIAVFTK
jgi:hypothetical protein